MSTVEVEFANDSINDVGNVMIPSVLPMILGESPLEKAMVFFDEDADAEELAACMEILLKFVFGSSFQPPNA